MAYSYTSENRLAGTGSIQLQYEITGNRLLQMYNSATGLDMRFGWSGDQMISEMNAAGWAIVRRYVPGPGTDEPVVWYEGAGQLKLAPSSHGTRAECGVERGSSPGAGLR